MALTFPLPLATFFDGLAIQSGTPDLGEAIEMSETGGGEILTAALGNRLWSIDISIASRTYTEGAAIQAKLDSLRYPGRSLLAQLSPMIGPFADPTGAILGAFTPALYAVQANNRDITVSGLPLNYTLTVGDFLSFTYGSNPTRYAIHQILVGGTTDANGRIAVELSSFVAPGYTLGTTIRLIKPHFKAIVKPGSVTPGTISGQRTEGFKFTLIQTFR